MTEKTFLSETTLLPENLEQLKAFLLKYCLPLKKALTFEEAVIYTGRSHSNLYKLTSKNRIPYSKPEGKMIAFDRVQLEEWMLSKPVRTLDSLETEAATHVALKRGRKGGWDK